jgi:RNA polymerase sigma-70 factor (ECF subfamily)
VTAHDLRGYHSSSDDDARLVESALAGSAEAFAELVDRHAAVCLRYATRMLGNREDAEEVTQDALLRAHGALDRFDRTMKFRTWLMSILINRCRTALLHRRRRTSRIQLDAAAVDAARAPDESGGVELRDAIERALARLDPTQREAFLLKHVESMSYEEMAVATGAGISALKMRVQRACDRLQLLLREDVNA